MKNSTRHCAGPKAALSGFTLIELLVVLSIMVLLTAVFTVNLSAQRQARDMKIAQNQLISNLRKTQSYTLSARALPSGSAGQYYVLRFDLASPTLYTILGISNSSGAQTVENVETITLPSTVKLSALSVSRSLNPVSQTIWTNCAAAAFVAPYAKVIFNDGCTPKNTSSNPLILGVSDDYTKIVNFLTNVPCDGNNGNPPSPTYCTASTDSKMVVTLSSNDNSISSRVLINGITGVICRTSDGETCPTSY